ncbi:MAG: hypothetical protein FJ098_04090 [Deltaproteobacteria bacterium]|nr:hypothetical protein [Deltaproteobacteria bacterium]
MLRPRLIVFPMVLLAACEGSAPAPALQFPDTGLRPEEAGEAPDDAAPAPDAGPAPDGGCVPSCEGRACGDDGCGGSCGTCPDGSLCLVKGGSALCVSQSCPPGERICQQNLVLECAADGSEYGVVEDCSLEAQHCVDGACSGCEPLCGGKQCGDDSCGGSCGSCGPSMACMEGRCLPSCDQSLCPLTQECIDVAGHLSLCGGLITFETDLDGNPLGKGANVETVFGSAGVLFSTASESSIVAVNTYEVDGISGDNSCASLDSWNQVWREDVFVRFVVPSGTGWSQGATHRASLYIAETWPGGIRVDFHAPDNPPGLPGGQPFHQAWTEEGGTAKVEFVSPTPIGYLVIRTADDDNFTFDDLAFGPVRPY